MLIENIQIPVVLGILGLLIITLIIDKFKASLVFLSTIALLVLVGALPVQDWVIGFSNTSILTIFLLIIITATVNEHFNMALLLDKLFGKTSSLRMFMLKMCVGVAGTSAVMNNTPVVAMMMPYVYSWGKKNKVNPSKLLIPLSYAAIVGGVITLIGTSTNLVLNGLLEDHGLELLVFSDFLLPGLLVTAACILFIFIAAPFILKDNKDLLQVFEENKRDYIIETKVSKGSPIIGLSLEEAGLRNLKGVFLAEIVRENKHYTAVSPDHQIEAGDILLFTGETDQIFELLNNGKGIELSKKSEFNIETNNAILEAVVSQNSYLDRKTVKKTGFRDKYDAAIIGIHRRGGKLSGKIGAMEIHTGDLLLISPGKEFQQRNSRNEDLIVINTMQTATDFSKKKKNSFLAILALSSLLALTNITSLFESLLLIVFAQILLGMLNLEKIKKSISVDLLMILVSSLALGHVLIESGTAQYITDVCFANAVSWSPLALVVIIFMTTFLLTSFVTNIAAIAIIFPVVFSIVSVTGFPPKPLFLTAAYAASCCFVTPFAYQTNLMVMEAGNYKFRDFVKMGLPLSLVFMAVYISYAIFKFDLL